MSLDGRVALACCKVGLDTAKPPREMLSVLLRSGMGGWTHHMMVPLFLPLTRMVPSGTTVPEGRVVLSM